MDFDWNNPVFEIPETLSSKDIEESFEDPFAVKLLPDSPRFSKQARFFNLGRSISGKSVFSYYKANGKSIRVIYSRPFVAEEKYLYLRKFNESLQQ